MPESEAELEARLLAEAKVAIAKALAERKAPGSTPVNDTDQKIGRLAHLGE